MIPAWLHILSILMIALGIGSAAIIVVDVAGHPQPMWIMNIVWPVVALFGTRPHALGLFHLRPA